MVECHPSKLAISVRSRVTAQVNVDMVLMAAHTFAERIERVRISLSAQVS